MISPVALQISFLAGNYTRTELKFTCFLRYDKNIILIWYGTKLANSSIATFVLGFNYFNCFKN